VGSARPLRRVASSAGGEPFVSQPHGHLPDVGGQNWIATQSLRQIQIDVAAARNRRDASARQAGGADLVDEFGAPFHEMHQSQGLSSPYHGQNAGSSRMIYEDVHCDQ
jgi:hypothetical protein